MGRPRGKIRELEQRRHLAVDLVQKGIPAVSVAQRFNIHERTIHKWLQAYRKDGLEGLQVKVSTGRKKKLTAKNESKLQKIIIAGAVKAGFANELWTSKRVLQIIKDQFDVDYHANHLPKLLRGLGFTPQRPQREAIEKDRKQMDNWIRFEWKRIKKKPAKPKPR
jgi:transposase